MLIAMKQNKIGACLILVPKKKRNYILIITVLIFMLLTSLVRKLCCGLRWKHFLFHRHFSYCLRNPLCYSLQSEKLLGSLGGIFSKPWKPKKTRQIKGPAITRGTLYLFKKKGKKMIKLEFSWSKISN